MVINHPWLVKKHTFSCCQSHKVDTSTYKWDSKVLEANLLEILEKEVSPTKKLKVNDADELFQPNTKHGCVDGNEGSYG